MATGQYDDAWETPGWTAQNMAYPPSDLIVVTTPPGLKALPVTGLFFDQSGRPDSGQFLFTPSVRVVHVGGAQVTLKPFRAQLRNGLLQNVSVVAPEDGATVSPSAWTWHVKQRVGPIVREYDLTVPRVGLSVDVTTLTSEDSTVVSDFPLARNYSIPAGTTFRREFQWLAQALDTWTAKMQLRTVFGGTVLLELENGSGITLSADGTIQFEISAAQSSEIGALNYPSVVYDLELYQPGGDTIRFLSGVFTFTPEVTQ